MTAVNNISFEIPKGEVFGLLGSNGAGKTTTLNMLSTLVYPTSGDAFLNGLDIKKDGKKIRKSIGVAFGYRMIYHRLTGRDNLKFYGRVYNVPDLEQKIDELNDFFGLKNRLDDLVETYSFGMKAKLALMRAMIHNPPILFLDEPTLGLDAGTARRLREKIKDLSSKGKTIVFCSHYLFEVEEICDRVAILHKGEMLKVDTPENLREKLKTQRKIEIDFCRHEDAKKFNSRFGSTIKENQVVIPIKNNDFLKYILKELSDNNTSIKDIQTTHPSLEDVFIEITK
ncbi:MAG: ABC transporter ATP-binding protein [Candidatus Margulisbacteria bacterium]|nr:ABC transporter ATP-binding protein [Candidatus Margulisiibacteriota bacterium]